MLILLPPSEGKASRRRGRPMDVASLVLPELTDARRRVMQALADASGRDDALSVLGVGASLADDVRANLELDSAPAMATRDLFTGVLYDALDLATLDAGDTRRATSRVLVFSAVHGVLRLTDRVSPFRCAMHVALPGVGPLGRFWATQLAGVLDEVARGQVVVDCRSGDYRAAWRPEPDVAASCVQVDVPGASHMAKHTRGLVARRLCRTDPLRGVEQLPDALGDAFRCELVPPKRPAQPWVARVGVVTAP